MNEVVLKIVIADVNKRIDKYIAEQIADSSRSYLQKLIKDGAVSVNGCVVKANYKMSEGDEVRVLIPEAVAPDIEPEDIELDIIYEDDDVLVVNKPKNMVVHPSAGHYSGTLVNALLFHCQDNLSGINGIMRPGIVHRIDMDTTGLLLVCKNDHAHQFISEQLHEHSITRRYRTIVWNNITEDEGEVDKPIGRHPNERKKMSTHAKVSKEAITHYQVLERFGKFCYIECVLETGRTHQIRVHMASIGHPVLGDETYGNVRAKTPFKTQGQCLHAMVLGFIHPSTKQYMEFEAPLPAYFENILDRLREQ